MRTKEFDQEIVELIKKHTPFREIMEKYGFHSTSKIARIKAEYIDEPKGKKTRRSRPMKQAHKNKLSITANAIAITAKSEIIVNNVIDILAGMRYSIFNLESIQSEQKEKSENVVGELQELNKKVDTFLDCATEVSTEAGMIELQKEKDALNKRIGQAIAEAGNFYARDTLRIKAIAELRNQFKAFVDLEIVAKGLTQVKEVLDTLFIAMQVLSDDTYVRFRNRAIEINPVVRGLFAKNEATVDEPDKPGETLDSDTNK
jgi:hypothetical protein